MLIIETTIHSRGKYLEIEKSIVPTYMCLFQVFPQKYINILLVTH